MKRWRKLSLIVFMSRNSSTTRANKERGKVHFGVLLLVKLPPAPTHRKTLSKYFSYGVKDMHSKAQLPRLFTLYNKARSAGAASFHCSRRHATIAQRTARFYAPINWWLLHAMSELYQRWTALLNERTTVRAGLLLRQRETVSAAHPHWPKNWRALWQLGAQPGALIGARRHRGAAEFPLCAPL